jgi:hypothetical protein
MGETKLQRALRRQVTAQSALDLLTAYASLQERAADAQAADGGGLLPLHVAIVEKYPVEVVQAILDAFPEGAKALTADGDTALHVACAHSCEVAVAQALLAVDPEGASRKNSQHCMAIHIAAAKTESVELVTLLRRCACWRGTALARCRCTSPCAIWRRPRWSWCC